MQIEHDMEDDMQNSALIMTKIKNDIYAQNLYAAMCNMRWQKSEVWPVLKNDLWSCTWRSSGGIVAELQGKGDYLDWYCSGMGGLTVYPTAGVKDGYVPESVVTEEIQADFRKLGWTVIQNEDNII